MTVMQHSRIHWWLAFVSSGALAVVSSVLVAGVIGNPTPVDRTLPIIVLALVVILGAAAGRTLRASAAVVLPMTLLCAVAIQEPTIRLLGYGLIVAVTVSLVTADLVRRDRPSAIRFTSIALAITALMVFIPAEPAFVSAKLLVFAGSALLAAVLWQGAAARPVGVAVIVLVAAGTPIEPLGAAMFPTVVALLLHYRMQRSHVGAALAIAAAAMAGRWAVALVLLPIVVDIVVRHRNSGSLGRSGFLVPFFPSWKNAAWFGRAVPFATSVAGRFAGLRRTTGASVVVILVTGFLLRPALTWLYILTAVTILVAESGKRISDAWDLPIMAVAFVVLMLFPWSGIAAIPPLPASVLAIGLTTAIASIPLGLGRSRLAGVATFAVFLGALWLTHSNDARPRSEIHAPELIGPGESISYGIDGVTESVAVRAFGANVNELRSGTLVGRIDLVGIDGRVWRRAIRVGDVADWGAFRPGYSFGTWNPYPADAVPHIEGFGAHAWVRPVGRIRVSAPVAIEAVTITADESLRAGAMLEVEGVEIR